MARATTEALEVTHKGEDTTTRIRDTHAQLLLRLDHQPLLALLSTMKLPM